VAPQPFECKTRTPDADSMFRFSSESVAQNLLFGPCMLNILILAGNLPNHSEPIIFEARGIMLHDERKWKHFRGSKISISSLFLDSLSVGVEVSQTENWMENIALLVMS
jgi:hypothetical protein